MATPTMAATVTPVLNHGGTFPRFSIKLWLHATDQRPIASTAHENASATASTPSLRPSP